MSTTGRYEEILHKAAGLFCEMGFRACSIRDIGKAVGTSSAALYYHFQSKDEVLLNIVQRGLQMVHTEVEQSIRPDLPAIENLRSCIRSHLRTCLDNRDFAIVIFREIRHLEDVSQQEARTLREQYEALWDGVLAKAQEEGAIQQDVDLHLFRLMLMGALNSVLNWFRPTGTYTSDQIGDLFLTFLTQGLHGNTMMEAAAKLEQDHE